MSVKSVCFLLVTLCIASSVNAQLPQFPFPFPFPNPFQPSPSGSPRIPGISKIPKIPGLPLPFPNPFQPSSGGLPGIPSILGIPKIPRLPDMNKCWSTFMDMPGCFAEIRQSVMTGKFGSIGPGCCKAFLDAEANCASNLPFKPIFPPMVKQQCSQAAGPPVTF